MSLPQKFDQVSALTKANVYFNGKVVSHSILFADGSKKTLGLIFPGVYHFGTELAERMEIVDGCCRMKLDGKTEWSEFLTNQAFEVPARSGFDIEVKEGICQYICSFLAK